VLRIQAKKGRNVFGLSPQGLARVTARSWDAMRKMQAGHLPEVPPPIVQPAPQKARLIPKVGTTGMTYAEPGVGMSPHAPGSETTGGLPFRQWLQFLRRPVPATGPGPRRPMNVLLNLIFGRYRK
jgi:hypothetical protein